MPRVGETLHDLDGSGRVCIVNDIQHLRGGGVRIVAIEPRRQSDRDIAERILKGARREPT